MDSKEQVAYLIDLRRSKVQSLLAAGASQIQIAQTLNVSEGTISTDVQYLRESAKQYVREYSDHFAQEYKECIDFLEQIQMRAWTASAKVRYERNLAGLLSVCLQTCLARAALISDVGLVQRTVEYIESIKKKRPSLLLPTDTQDTAIATDTQESESVEEETTVAVTVDGSVDEDNPNDNHNEEPTDHEEIE
jgi:hypothetical protein